MIINIVRVAPSILAIDYNNKEVLDKAIETLENSYASMIHLDVMDGKFVPNVSFDERLVNYIKGKTTLLLDVHLMVEKPELHIDKYIKAGADILSVHYEACDKEKLIEILKRIKSKSLLAGVAISPKTPAYKIKEIIKTGLVDVIVVMGVEPGAYGQEFIPGSAEKVAEIREMDRSVLIEIDGGVNLKNAQILRKMGANILVSGATVFGSKNIKKTIRALKGNDYISQIKKFFGFNKKEEE